jgi:homoserine kinase type II
MKTPDDIYLDLIQTSKSMFGMCFFNPVPLTLWLLNLKWKVEAEEGVFVLKQFSKERYERFDIGKVRLEQQIALWEQVRQYENGTACPKLLTHNGNVIHVSPNGERFSVMEFLPGSNLVPGTLNDEEMYSLGCVTGHMHNIFNDGTHGFAKTTKFVPPSITKRMEQWKSLSVKAQEDERLLNLMDKQIRATEQFDLDLISSCEAGWAHRDLWVDNILFMKNQVSAILDFDRFAFDYPELDIARAVMSGALNGQQLNVGSVTAFLDGYRTKRELKKGILVRSLQLLWYLESVWWIVPDINWDRCQEVQFANEMTWLAENLMQLSVILGDL